MIPINDHARRYRRLLEQLAHTSTEGVQVEVLEDDFARPSTNGLGRVQLPIKLFALGNERELILSWRHELAHARSFIDHRSTIFRVLNRGNQEEIQQLKEQLELIAELAEVSSGLLVDPHWPVDRGV